jgi:hypothetical protein
LTQIVLFGRSADTTYLVTAECSEKQVHNLWDLRIIKPVLGGVSRITDGTYFITYL